MSLRHRDRSTAGELLMLFTLCAEHSDVVPVVHRFSDCTQCSKQIRSFVMTLLLLPETG